MVLGGEGDAVPHGTQLHSEDRRLPSEARRHLLGEVADGLPGLAIQIMDDRPASAHGQAPGRAGRPAMVGPWPGTRLANGAP